MLLTVGGITLIGIVTAKMASMIVQRVTAEDTEHQAVTVAEINNLRSGLEKRITMRCNGLRQLSDEIAQNLNAPRAATTASVGVGERYTPTD